MTAQPKATLEKVLETLGFHAAVEEHKLDVGKGWNIERAKKIIDLVWKLDEAKNVDELMRALEMPSE